MTLLTTANSVVMFIILALLFYIARQVKKLRLDDEEYISDYEIDLLAQLRRARRDRKCDR